MVFTRPVIQRALISAMAPILVLAAIVVPMEAAGAATSLPAPISNQALPTVQVDGVVWTQVVVGSTVYAGGQFTSARPAGAAPGQQTVPRTDLLAYDVTTGKLIPGFAPVINGQVRGLAASPDGSRIYVAGDFTKVDGQAHAHLAALNPRNGATIAGFSPSVNGRVYSVTATSGTVFFGGSFTGVNGVARPRAAAVTTGGALTAFAPRVADYDVRAVAVSPDRSKVVLGGRFTSVNGRTGTTRGLAAVSFLTGASLRWAASSVIVDSGVDSGITSLSGDADYLYATGYVYHDSGNLEGSAAMSWADGSIHWLEDCHGDSYSAVPYDGALYVVGHAHYCGNIGGWQETDPRTFHRAIGFSKQVTGAVSANTTAGHYANFAGQPAPSLLNWYPDLMAGTYTGLYQAAWSIAAGDGYVVLGGEFPRVNGQRQYGLVRFQGTPDAGTPAAPDPTPAPVVAKPHAPAKPSVIALGQRTVGVKWAAPIGAKAAGVSRYLVRVTQHAHIVKDVRVSAAHLRTVIAGLKRHVTYSVVVYADGKAGWSKRSTAAHVTTHESGPTVSSTKAPARVAKPTAKAGATTVTVRWKAATTAGATPVVRYQIRVYRHGVRTQTITVSRTRRSVVLRHLVHGAWYTVTVRAANWAAYGKASTARSVRTGS